MRRLTTACRGGPWLNNGDAQRRDRRRWAIRAARTGSGRRPSRLRPEERRVGLHCWDNASSRGQGSCGITGREFA
jgi:hypothetical protein